MSSPIDAIFGHSELRVVVIVGVNADSVGKRGAKRTGTFIEDPMTVAPELDVPCAFR